MFSQAYRLGSTAMARATARAKKCVNSERASALMMRQMFRIRSSRFQKQIPRRGAAF